jgi:hypothetical protein
MEGTTAKVEPMDEFERLRQVLDEVSPADPGAKERARKRLDQAIGAERDAIGRAPKRRWRKRPITWIGLAAAVAAMVVLVQSLLPPGGGGPPLSAAAQLRQLGRIAADTPSPTPGPGSYLYFEITESSDQGFSSLQGGGSFFVSVQETLQRWVAADGSGRQVTTVTAVSFPTEADKAAWEKAGEPPIPEAGDVTTDNFDTGSFPSFAELSSLPTDPSSLDQAIRGGKAGPTPPGDYGVWVGISNLIGQPEASASLRQGLFEVAATLPGVVSLGDRTDPLGRQGIGLSLNRGPATEVMIFDPQTSALLSWQSETAGAPSGSEAFGPASVVGSDTATPSTPTPSS